MGEVWEAYIRDQADKEIELRDLRMLVAALVDKAGGEVTFKRSSLHKYYLERIDSMRFPVEIVVDDIYDSVVVRGLKKRLDTEQTVEE